MDNFIVGYVVGVLITIMWFKRSGLMSTLKELKDWLVSTIVLQWELFKINRRQVKDWDPMDEPMEMNYDPRQDRKDV